MKALRQIPFIGPLRAAQLVAIMQTKHLEMAWFQRRAQGTTGLIFHSDRGSQYASHELRAVLKEYGIQASVSHKGNGWGNAPTEMFFGFQKVGLHGQRFVTIRQAKDETVAWLRWHNKQRIHSTLNYVNPVEFGEDRIALTTDRAHIVETGTDRYSFGP